MEDRFEVLLGREIPLQPLSSIVWGALKVLTSSDAAPINLNLSTLLNINND